MTHDDILKSALGLPEAERIILATELFESVGPTPPGLSIDDPGFEEELERRFHDGSEHVAWSEVQRQLDDDLKP